jgi:hypothetical protein
VIETQDHRQYNSQQHPEHHAEDVLVLAHQARSSASRLHRKPVGHCLAPERGCGGEETLGPRKG